MKRLFLAAAALGFTSFLASAQDSHPLIDALVKHWQTSKNFTLAVVDKMPDDQFSFKATDAEMSFGQMASHIADADFSYCSAAFGATPPAKGKDFTKAGATKHISAAFDFCIAGMQKLSDADLTKTIGSGKQQSTPFERLWGGFTHTAHHRAALEVYLRLKSLEPPKYEF